MGSDSTSEASGDAAVDDHVLRFPAVDAVVDRARRGDAQALPELREMLKQHPELIDRVGDLAGHAKRAWLNVLTRLGTSDATVDLLAHEALDQRAEKLRSELQGDRPSPLEALVVSRIVLLWLQSHHADLSAAQAVANPRMADLILKRQERLARMMKSAIDQLAQLRRLSPASLRLVTDAA